VRELSLNANEVEPLAVFRKPFNWDKVALFLTQFKE